MCGTHLIPCSPGTFCISDNCKATGSRLRNVHQARIFNSIRWIRPVDGACTEKPPRFGCVEIPWGLWIRPCFGRRTSRLCNSLSEVDCQLEILTHNQACRHFTVNASSNLGKNWIHSRLLYRISANDSRSVAMGPLTVFYLVDGYHGKRNAQKHRTFAKATDEYVHGVQENLRSVFIFCLHKHQ